MAKVAAKQPQLTIVKPLPPTKEEKQEQEAEKKDTKQLLLPWITFAQPLKESEAKQLHGDLRAALRDYFEYMDEALVNVQQNRGYVHIQKEVWSNVDDEELEKVTKALLKWAQRSSTAATVVNGLLAGKEYVDLGVILGPRVVQSAFILAPRGGKRR